MRSAVAAVGLALVAALTQHMECRTAKHQASSAGPEASLEIVDFVQDCFFVSNTLDKQNNSPAREHTNVVSSRRPARTRAVAPKLRRKPLRLNVHPIASRLQPRHKHRVESGTKTFRFQKLHADKRIFFGGNVGSSGYLLSPFHVFTLPPCSACIISPFSQY